MPALIAPRLADAVLAPPFNGLIALLLVLGLERLGRRAARAIYGESFSREQAAFGFLIVTAAVAAITHVVAWLGVAMLPMLRALAVGVAAASLAWLDPRVWRRVAGRASVLRQTFSRASGLERGLILLSSATLAALALASVAPPTDADSLAYHLAVPLDWLRHGRAIATPDWLHARLAGLGESLNLLGLSAGTDAFGAMLQVSGVIVALSALTSVAGSATNALLGIALVLACPLLPGLVLTAKPQMLPAAATTLVVADLLRRERGDRAFDGPVWPLWTCLAFAAGCKYSFLPSALIAGVLVLRHAGAASILPGVAAIGALTVPTLLRTALWYGDPVSPFLERFKNAPDEAVTSFAWYLRQFGGLHSIGTLVRLPVRLVATLDVSAWTTVLGAGAFAVLLTMSRQVKHRGLLAATVVLTLILCAGQLQGRFFLEPYLWCGVLAVAAPWTTRKRLLRGVLGAQMLATTAVAIAAVGLVPGGVTASGRERVLGAYAADYRAIRWLNAVLPPNAVVAMDGRSALFMERPVLSGDVPAALSFVHAGDRTVHAELDELLRRHGITTLVVREPLEQSVFRALADRLGPPIHTAAFQEVGRNLFTERTDYRLSVYLIK